MNKTRSLTTEESEKFVRDLLIALGTITAVEQVLAVLVRNDLGVFRVSAWVE